MLRIAQSLARRDNDGVAGMHADRIKVLHVADGDEVACAVADDFVFDFLPACHTALNQVFMHAGRTQTVRADFAELLFVLGNAAACSA